MKKASTKLTFFLLLIAALVSQSSQAQCPGGYTQARLNWDNLDYYYNSGSNVAPYGHSSGNYITNALEQTQKFGIGKQNVTIVTSAAGLVDGENATHSGDLTVAGIPYTGQDAQFTATANGQTITMTFSAEVANTYFTLYDIDGSARIDIDAYNSVNAAQNVNVTLQGGSILTTTNNNNINTFVSTASVTNLAASSNQGSATVYIASNIDRIVITFTTRGSNPVIWLSDITACVTGTFPTDYHQTGENQHFTGPTENMPYYFLVTPDNNSAYYLDPATGNARWLFTDTERDYINSFGYDPYNRHLYYITEDVSINSNNKQLKRFDYNTETSSVLIANITTTLGIPTFNAGIESAGCAFYDGALYLGIEGGKYDVSGTSSDRTRETIVWRVDLDAGLNPTNAYQVYASNAYLDASNTSIHDWGDFVIRDGVLFNFNTARNGGSYSQSKYHHYDLQTQEVTNLFNNPTTSVWNGQAGMTWDGNLFYFRGINGSSSGVGSYDEAGNQGGIITINVVGGGPAWPQGAGDASDPFRPKCDFGDAPASYDPDAFSPAVHERSENLRLGATWGMEWIKVPGVNANSDTDEDATPFTPILGPGSGTSYLLDVSVYNNSGADATLIAWLDYDGNGVFDASEAITPITVPTSAVQQNVLLYWPLFSCPIPVGSLTYLRIRITPTTSGMTTSHATGYFTAGEVEDYRIVVDNYPLGVNLLAFDAKAVDNKEVKLDWKSSEEQGFAGYDIERSANGNVWTRINSVNANGTTGVFNYTIYDAFPLKGISYYRLKLKEPGRAIRFSDVRKVQINANGFSVSVIPNPARNAAHVKLKIGNNSDVTIRILSEHGKVMHLNTVYLEAGEHNYPLPLGQGWAAGYYMVQVSANGLTTTRKMIVTK